MMVAWDDEQATAPIKWDDEQPQVKWDNEGVSASPTDLANQALKGTGITVGAPPTPQVRGLNAPAYGPSPEYLNARNAARTPQQKASDQQFKAETAAEQEALTSPGGVATGVAEAVLPGSGHMVRGAIRATQPGQHVSGALESAGGATDVLSPLIGPALFENPANLAKGMGVGMATGYGAKKGAEKLGATPEEQDLAEQVGFFLPSIAGAIIKPRAAIIQSPEVTGAAGEAFGGRVAGGAAVTPEEIRLSGRVGSRTGNIRIPRNGSVGPVLEETPPIEGQEVPPTPDKVAEAAQAMVRANAAENPQPVQAPPAPPPVSGPVVDAVAKEIAKAPPEQRDALIAEAHQKATESILHHGSAVVDGEVHSASNQAQAAKAAAKIINEAVEKADAESDLEQARRGASEAPKSEITNAVPPEQRASTKIVKDAQENAAGRVESRVAEKKAAEKPEVAGTPEGATRDTALFQQAKTELGPDASMSAVAQRAQQLKSEPLAKGSKVTLPSGEPATVTYVHPKMSIVRYKTDGGENGSIAKSKLSASTVAEPQERNGSAAEPTLAPSGNGSGPFTERDISRFNSFTHYPKDRAAENAKFASESAAIEADARERLKRGGVDEVPIDVREAIDSYNRARYEQSMAFTRAREVAPPWSVVGRSNYKGKPLKARAIERKAIEATEAAKTRMERAIKQHGPSRAISSDAPDAIQQLQGKIEQAEKLHGVMKSANVIVRKSSLSDAQKIEELSKLDGLNEKRAAELLKPDFAGRKGFADYELTSSTTNIRRMNERIAELTRSRSTAGNEVAFDGGKLIDNAEANRVQIKYAERPPLTIIQKLKAKGFRWAPSEGVWQRQRTDSARYDAEQITGGKLPKPEAEQVSSAASAPEPEPVATINGRTFEASTEPVTPKQEVAPGTETPTKLSELKRQLDELLDSKMPTEPKPRQEWVSKQRRLESAIKDAESEARYSGVPETKPPDGVALPDAAKDLRAHQKAYFQESLKPVMAAWDKLVGADGYLHDQLIKGTQKPKDKPTEFQGDYIHIEVPQDGKFLIVNTPYAINRALKGSVQAFAAVKPQTFPNRNATSRSPKEFDNERYIAGLKEEIAQLEKDVHNAPRADYAREQLKAARENLAEATNTDEGISFGLSVPGVAQATEALGKAATVEYDSEIKPFLQKSGLSLTKALTELQHLIAPRAGVPTATLDSAMKLTGQREKHRWYLEQTLSKAQAMFDKLSRDEQIAFIDAFKTGEKQPTPELQHIADFMGKTDDATYRQVIEAQIANMSKTAQKVWNRIGADKQDEFLDGIKDFDDDAKLKAFVKTLPSGVQLLKTAPDALKEIADGILHYKDNHYRVLWKTIPGSKITEDPETGEDVQARAPQERGGLKGRRPLQGSKGFLKQSTLNTMSEGLDRGGEPVSYNPVTMFQLAQADSWRYITAQRMWKDALDQKGRVFVKRGERGPEGFKKLEEDRIGNVRFPAASGEGPIEAGNWYLREDWHRLLSNMLSHDYIRESTIGSGLMAAKNQLTAYRLGLSPFHAFTTSFSSIGGQVGRGLGEINYALRSASVTHAVEGLKDIATAPIAPVSDYRLGTSLVRYATNKDEFLKTLRGQDFIKQYPEADALLDRLFSSGAKLSLHEDEKLRSIEGLRQAASENRWIAAVLKSPFALNQWVFRPLSGFYIPRLKLASFLKDYSQALVDHRPDIDAGKMTEGELGRKIWDSTENVYGQMNWDARWWDRTFKSAIQFTFRAFTWFAGNARLVKDAGLGQSREFWESAKWWGDRFGSDNVNPSSGPIPRLDPNFAKLLGLALVWMGGNAALQYAMTHEKAKDAKDLMAARIGGVDSHGKPRRVTIPIIAMHDAMSLWYGGLKSYMRNKLSDVLSGVYDVLTNEDFKHDMVHDPDASFWKQREQDAEHILGAPIGISTTRSQMQRGATEHKAALSLAGISPAPSNYDYTPLEQKLSDILRAKHAPLTVEDQEQLGAKRERIAAGNATAKGRIAEFRYQRKGFVKSLATRPEITYSELSRAMADANAIEKHELMPVLAQKRLAVLRRGAVAQ